MKTNRIIFHVATIFYFVALTSCKTNHLADITTEFYSVEAERSIAGDDEIEALISPYRSQLESEMNEVIGHVEKTLTKESPESTMGNWYADLCKVQTEKLADEAVDFAVLNQGGMRIPSIAAGPITKGKIFEFMPFDNAMVMMELSGKEVKALADHIARGGGWPVSKEFRFNIEDRKAKDVTIKGLVVDDNKKYKIATIDYLANGGSGAAMLKTIERKELGILLRDLIISYIKDQDTPMTAQLDGRIKLLN
ncbi:MAG: 5'-nucleotidase C-terminal domain-containing protein [Bacteroidota bacterium]